LLTIARHIAGKGISRENLHTHQVFSLIAKVVSVATVRNMLLVSCESMLSPEDVERITSELLL